MNRADLQDRIRTVTSADFAELAVAVFRYQAAGNPIYARWLELLRCDPAGVRGPTDIPHLPIGLFKRHALQTGRWEPARVFTSSGTTGATTSRHLLHDEAWYRTNARRAFEVQYGPLAGRPVLALLPAYLERTGSSLVFMADDFIQRSGHPASGFFLDDLPGLLALLQRLLTAGEQPLLIGVSFALLDLADLIKGEAATSNPFLRARPQVPGKESNSKVGQDPLLLMETGGMKGRRRELTRPELHARLRAAFGVRHVHSEYGMTELLSQAYAPRDGRFLPAPTLRASLRELTDPGAQPPSGKTGALNLTDLANLDTISFLATDDLGRVYPDGSFEVLGRMDASDVRGCNLLVSDV